MFGGVLLVTYGAWQLSASKEVRVVCVTKSFVLVNLIMVSVAVATQPAYQTYSFHAGTYYFCNIVPALC